MPADVQPDMGTIMYASSVLTIKELHAINAILRRACGDEFADQVTLFNVSHVCMKTVKLLNVNSRPTRADVDIRVEIIAMELDIEYVKPDEPDDDAPSYGDERTQLTT